MAKTKQTPLTVEKFRELLMPEINKQFTELRQDLTSVAHTVNELKVDMDEVKEKIKYIPTVRLFHLLP